MIEKIPYRKDSLITVVMPNLNYNFPQKKDTNPLEIQILNMIKKDNKISTRNVNNVRSKFQDYKTSH